MKFLRLIVVLLLLALPVMACAELKVISTYPVAGATDVSPVTEYIRIWFSEPVRTDGYSFVNTKFGEPLDITGAPKFEENNTVCILPVKLMPGIKYSVSINSEKFTGFRSARDTYAAAKPYLLTFTTKEDAEEFITAVRVTGTFPIAQAKNVDTSITKMRIRFSEPVRSDAYSFVNTNQGQPLEITGKPVFEEGGRVCILPVRLQPGITYSVGINNEKFQNFRSLKNPDVKVTPFVLTFTTKGARKSSSDAWREDLAILAKELPQRHKNLFFASAGMSFNNL